MTSSTTRPQFHPFGGISTPGQTGLVRVGDGGQTGSICVRGQNNHGSEGPQQAVAKMFGVNDNPPSSPLDPMTGQFIPGLTTGVIDPPGGFDYRFLREPGGANNEVPGAACNASATGVSNNKIAVWTLFSDGWDLQTALFEGVCSNTTDCEASGSGGGVIVHVAYTAGVAAPAQWRLRVGGAVQAGGQPGSGRLGDTWVLDYRGGNVWHTGDRGPCDPGRPSWALFALPDGWYLDMNGLALYRQTVADWDPLGPNELLLHAAPAAADRLPVRLRVEPA
jgi:hypothetical protein